MSKEFKLTKESYQKLKDELEYLKIVREKEVADQIKEARSFGDLSENSEYDEAKNEQGKVFSRKAELENILANAVIIDESDRREDAVSHGARVTVLLEGEDEEEVYVIVGSQEANPGEGRISDESPFGKALMGKMKGEKAVVDAPAGKMTYLVVNIEF